MEEDGISDPTTPLHGGAALPTSLHDGGPLDHIPSHSDTSSNVISHRDVDQVINETRLSGPRERKKTEKGLAYHMEVKNSTSKQPQKPQPPKTPTMDKKPSDANMSIDPAFSASKQVKQEVVDVPDNAEVAMDVVDSNDTTGGRKQTKPAKKKLTMVKHKTTVKKMKQEVVDAPDNTGAAMDVVDTNDTTAKTGTTGECKQTIPAKKKLTVVKHKTGVKRKKKNTGGGNAKKKASPTGSKKSIKPESGIAITRSYTISDSEWNDLVTQVISEIQNEEAQEVMVEENQASTASGATQPLDQLKVPAQIIQASSTKNRDKLFDNAGYSYVLKRENKDGITTWRCPMRNKDVSYCPAALIQRGETFRSNGLQHTHPPQTGLLKAAQVKMEIRKRSIEEPQKSAAAIIKEVMLEENLVDNPCPALPSVDTMIHGHNRHRKKLRSMDPTDMLCTLLEEDKPDSLAKGDLKCASSSPKVLESEASRSSVSENLGMKKRRRSYSPSKRTGSRSRSASSARVLATRRPASGTITLKAKVRSPKKARVKSPKQLVSPPTQTKALSPLVASASTALGAARLPVPEVTKPPVSEVAQPPVPEVTDPPVSEVAQPPISEVLLPIPAQLIEASSNQSKDKLYDNAGYSYILKLENKDGSKTWRCPTRNKDVYYCPAILLQRGETFRSNGRKHTHPPQTGILQAVQVKIKIRKRSIEEPQKSAAAIVKEVMLEENLVDNPCPALPSVNTMIHVLKRYRKKLRSKEEDKPDSLDKDDLKGASSSSPKVPESEAGRSSVSENLGMKKRRRSQSPSKRTGSRSRSAYSARVLATRRPASGTITLKAKVRSPKKARVKSPKQLVSPPTQTKALSPLVASVSTAPGAAQPPVSEVAQHPAPEVLPPIPAQLIEASSIQKKDKVYDNAGYSYIFKQENKDGSTTWRCPMRNKEVSYCPAVLTQRGETFRRNALQHTHPPQTGLLKAAQVKMKIRKRSIEEPHKSAAAIVKEVMLEENLVNNPCPALPSVVTMAHVLNRYRKKLRSKEPTDMPCTLMEEDKPDSQDKGDLKGASSSSLKVPESEAGQSSVSEDLGMKKRRRSHSPSKRTGLWSRSASSVRVLPTRRQKAKVRSPFKARAKSPKQLVSPPTETKALPPLVATASTAPGAAQPPVPEVTVPEVTEPPVSEIPTPAQLIEASSNQLKDKVYDNAGYSYIFKQEYSDGSKNWRCPLRNRQVSYCPAVLIQIGETFRSNGRHHTHPPRPGLLKAVQVKMKLRKRSIEEPHKSTSTIIKEVMREENLVDNPCPALPSVDTLTHVLNRYRKRLRSMKPIDMLCTVMKEDKPDSFLRGALEGTSSSSPKVPESEAGWSSVLEDSGMKKRQRSHSPPESTGSRSCSASSTTVLATQRPASGMTIFRAKVKPEQLVSSPSPTKARPPVPEDLPLVPAQVIEASSTRSKDKVYDNAGYSYILKRKNKDGSKNWRCPLRNKDVSYCPAALLQIGETFRSNGRQHTHPPQTGLIKAVEVKMDIRKRSIEEPHKSTSTIIKEVLRKENLVDTPCPGLPSVNSMIHVHNKHRQKRLFPEPVDMHFTLLEEQLPGSFLRGDLKGANTRHILFASNEQLELLAEAKCWYINGTVKIIKQPFTQLISIHAFAQKEGKAKQVPLLFIFMSSHSKEDYIEVFTKVRSLQAAYAVERIVLDFDWAAWQGLSTVFPYVDLKGCAFQWGQTVFTKVQDFGLRQSYLQNNDVRELVKNLFALRFLPYHHIPPIFNRLTKGLTTPRLLQLADYMRSTWIEGSTWSPESWSVYFMPIRTHNDLEEWHRPLGTRGRCKGQLQVPFYTLVNKLHKEANLPAHKIRLLECGQPQQMHRTQYQQQHNQLFSLWEEYHNGDLSAIKLLAACSELYAPIMIRD